MYILASVNHKYIYIYIFNTFARAQGQLLNEVQVLTQSFPSPILVVILRLTRPICSTIYPELVTQ